MATFKTFSIVGSLVIAVPLFLAAGPAQARQNAQQETIAATSNAASSAAAPAGSKVKGKKICRNIESTGTRMPFRACHTAQEWKKIEQMR